VTPLPAAHQTAGADPHPVLRRRHRRVDLDHPLPRVRLTVEISREMRDVLREYARSPRVSHLVETALRIGLSEIPPPWRGPSTPTA
jgi:hypothetical protein